MDEAVNPVRLKAALACCMLAAAGASAQPLSDPTRPPAAFMAHAAGAPSAASAAAQAAPQLQSILIAPGGGRNVAVIDGQTVRPGDMFRGAKVERMTQTEVVLSKGGRKQVLKLFPATPAGKGDQPVQQ